MMTEAELSAYLHRRYPRENECCEWKAFTALKHAVAGSAGEDVISYVSAIANMDGGHLVMGVEDRSLRILGIQNFADYTPENLPQKLLDHCTSLSTEGLRVESFTTSDTGKTVWVLHIPRHLPRRAVTAHKRAWQRIGDSLVAMTEERHTAILREPLHASEDWSAAIVPDATLDDLDPKALVKARENFLSKYPDKIEEAAGWDDLTFLNKAKVIIRGQITRTAILLLGQPEAEHFINPAEGKIRWILKDAAGVEKDYRIYSPPLLLAVDEVFARIRNLKYRYMRPEGGIFPEEVDQYEPYVIREGLHNCIAHQDYTIGGRINVVESDDQLIFSNKGSFIPGSVETVIRENAPEELYRNKFLAEAMVHLKMVDTIGSGIRRMFLYQRARFFPMPDYDLSGDKVKVTITGKVLDPAYAEVLSRNPDLDLTDIILLDKVQKHRPLADEEIRWLRSKGLIEGRKPIFHISAKVASTTDQKPEYIHARGLDDEFYKGLVVQFLDSFQSATRPEIDALLFPKLPEVLTDAQKKHRIKNLLQTMKREYRVALTDDRRWVLPAPPF